jgi:protein-tyrosine phosphatase/arsenate reductase
MFPSIKSYCDDLVKEFDSISSNRKSILDTIANYIIHCQKSQLPIQLVYICTHNSRRSHFGQVWARTAANYYGIQQVHAFSGGTEATAFNVNAIKALENVGFHIQSNGAAQNPVYSVCFGENECTSCFSKVYNDEVNPTKNFLAIMTCGEAEANCPFIPGASARIATTYEDPKLYDGTPEQDKAYADRCRQIALETLYVFSKVHQ